MNSVIVWLGPEVLLSLLPKINLGLYLGFSKNQFLTTELSSWAMPGHFKLTVSISLRQCSFQLQSARLKLAVEDEGGGIGFGGCDGLGLLDFDSLDQHAVEEIAQFGGRFVRFFKVTEFVIGHESKGEFFAFVPSQALPQGHPGLRAVFMQLAFQPDEQGAVRLR